MRLKSLAVAAGVLLVAVFAALAIAVYFVDPRAIALSLAASVQAETGRELRFEKVDVKLLPRPALVVTQLRFANAAWGTQPWLAQAARATADIDAWALFSGRLRIQHIALDGAQVLLETDAAGMGNWVMGADRALPKWLKQLEIDRLDLQSLLLTYRDGKSGQARSLQIDAARIAAPQSAQPIQLDVRGSFDGKPMQATGSIGGLEILAAHSPAYPLDLEGKLGPAAVGVHGSLDLSRDISKGDQEKDLSFKLALRAQAPELAELAALFNAKLPPLGPLRATAQLNGTTDAPALSALDIAIGGGEMPEIKLSGTVANLRTVSGLDLQLAASASAWWLPGTAAKAPRLPPFRASARLRDAKPGARVRDAKQAYRVDDLDLRIAGSVVNASLQITQLRPRLRITGKATSSSIDLTRLTPRSGSAKAAPAKVTPAKGTQSSDLWKLADLDLDLKIGRLVLPDGRQMESGSGRLALDNGRLKASALQATLGGATLRLDGSIADPQQLAGIDLQLVLQGSELAELFKFMGTEIAPVGPYQSKSRMLGSLNALRLTEMDTTVGPPEQRLRVSGQVDDALKWRGVDLALALNVRDSPAAGRLFGVALPRLPALRATARLTDPQDGLVFDDLKFTLGRSSMQGRLALVRGEPRPRVTANLGGPLLDLHELSATQDKPGASNPLLAADVEADIRFERVLLPDQRALGPVSGGARLTAGALELKQFSVAVDGASVTMDGKISDPRKLAGLDLLATAKYTRSTGLAAFTRQRLPDLPPFTARGRVTDVPSGYAVAGLQLAYAATTISGDVAVTRGAQRYKIKAKASSPLLDLSAFTAADKAAKPSEPRTRAIPDVALPVDFLRDFDADLDLRIDSVKYSNAAPLGPLQVHAELADGRLNAKPAQLTIKEGQTLSVSGTVDAAQSDWALKITGTGIDLGEMLARFGHPGAVSGGSTDLLFQFNGRGKTLPALFASLDGEVRVKIGPHRIHRFAVDLESGMLVRLMGMANPFRKTDPYTDVKCVAIQVPIRDGVIVSDRRMASETAKYNVVLSGKIDLRTEALDLAVTPIVTSGFSFGQGQVSEVVWLRGTLAAPTYGIDPISVVTSAASLASVATPGWWIADALLKKARADPSPCATALAPK